ncbi:MAG: hypothetical protein LBC98_08920 [Prevotellaceae bacterium]|jgi:iron uptake system EfeUOB component EfeO/EfeM|nr:hypothetical protein [Prevotellaceae bacterium]
MHTKVELVDIIAAALQNGHSDNLEISIRELKNIRSKIENKNKSIYVDITFPSIDDIMDRFYDKIRLSENKVVVDALTEPMRKAIESHFDSLPDDCSQTVLEVVKI